MGQWNREVLEKIKKLCLDRDTEDPKAFYPCQDILGLVFLRFICAAAEFNSKDAPVPPAQAAGGDGRREFQAGERGSDPENERRDRDPEVFIVPDSAAWDRIFPGGKKNGEGGPEPAAKGADQNLIPVIARAIRAIERENPALRDLFPRVLTRTAGRRSSESPGPDAPFLPELGCLLGGLSAPEAGQVFTELMAEFETRAAPLLVRGVRPRTAPVPRGIANLLALMLEPYRGRFYDPCCGAANLPAGAADFVSSRRGKLQELSFYAQEREAEAWRLARMNLLVRGIDASEIRLNADGPLQKDPHRDIKFDFIAACPPPGEDSYLWIRYTLDRLSAGGLGALILPRSSLASPRAGDREIRRSLVEGRLLDCVVNLPARIFSGHSPSPCIWFFSRAKISRGRRGDEVLFIDARNLGRPVNRRQREFSAEDINRIARTYHNWRFPKTVPYRDLRSFALSAHIAQIRAAAYSLNPAFYLGIPEEEEETNRGAQFEALRAEFEALVREESRLSRQTAEALRKIRGGDLG
ncbi:MAG: SAM-dependent methyltransferase [Treponema sp.]|jgi:type I restriction enzyme M protein|nr:SAM-dependent methyltransferase [Treponema sp.]